MQIPDNKMVLKLPGQIFQDDNNTNNKYLVVYVKYFYLLEIGLSFPVKDKGTCDLYPSYRRHICGVDWQGHQHLRLPSACQLCVLSIEVEPFPWYYIPTSLMPHSECNRLGQ